MKLTDKQIDDLAREHYLEWDTISPKLWRQFARACLDLAVITGRCPIEAAADRDQNGKAYIEYEYEHKEKKLMKPFNLDEAKAGKPFYYFRNTRYDEHEYRFVGVAVDGDILYEQRTKNSDDWYLIRNAADRLRMCPEKKVCKLLLIRAHSDGWAPFVVYDNEGEREYYKGRIIKEFELEYED